ncbi:MAG: fibrobacter succinogenes major paralogous domain-containing protein [Candidatus Cloacimonetes bacterium]|nr:fibrobacter succinogenes major paralogous domain-containing protein [Candidatus Cloacimonadota bacterium]
MLIMVSLIFFSCSKDSTGPKNDKPDEPSTPSPADNSIDISINQTLNWSCSDPDDDSLTYDVYFGESTDPPIVNDGQSSTSYDPGTLNETTTYFWKIVAHDDHSNSTIGDIWEFTTTSGGTSTVTDIDGNIYQIIKIGDQWWLAENLRVTHYRNGDPIPEVTDNSAWVGLTTGAYCNYDNDDGYVSTYGHLYNWYAVDDSRGIAPDGWHVPTDDEWKELEMYLGMTQAQADDIGWRGTDEGGKLKETGYEHWNSPNTVATNESGFTALPGGCRYYCLGDFCLMDTYAYFWSSSEYYGSYAWCRFLSYHYSFVSRNSQSKYEGFSFRCVKD